MRRRSSLGGWLPPMGSWTFFVLTGIGVFAAMQFVRMHRELTRLGLAPGGAPASSA